MFVSCNEQSVNINKGKILGTTKKAKCSKYCTLHSGREEYEVLLCPSLARLLGLGMDGRSGPLGKFIKQCISQELLEPRLMYSAKCGEKREGRVKLEGGRGGPGRRH